VTSITETHTDGNTAVPHAPPAGTNGRLDDQQPQQAAASPGAVPPSGNRTPTDDEPFLIQLPDGLKEFVRALFRPDDEIEIRPIELWTDNGKSRRRILYKQRRYLKPHHVLKAQLWKTINDRAAEERANVFFSACPRPKSHCNRANHIRVVLVLWADLDHCTVEEARQRCKRAGLPEPSIVVRTGHGVHLYWLLCEPFLIDDAPEPIPVLTEFTNGAKKTIARNYIVCPSTKERVYEFFVNPKTGEPDHNRPNPEFPRELTPKARHVQDVLAGIASLIGGDSTQDLSRRLRMPFTLNRKEQRNGVEPIPCTLEECDGSRRYAFSEFERFANLTIMARA
jgi:hypothetical protein